MFTYRQVEAALAGLHNVDDVSLGAFRGRIKHFQRLGVVPRSPGKGRKISYTFDDAFVWAFCLELSEFGMDPTIILIVTEYLKPSLLKDETLSKLEGNNDKVYFIFYPNLLSLVRGRDKLIGSLVCKVTFNDPPSIHSKDTPWLNERFAFINLSHVHRELGKRLRS
jgi:hypothetical protein